MSRYPRIYLASLANARAERRFGPVPIADIRTREVEPADPRTVDRRDGIVVTRHEIAVDDRTIPVWAYRPPGGAPTKPAHLFFHHGGFYSGNPLHLDRVSRLYATAADCVVLAVGYRLAPEHPWPAATEDAYAALSWAATTTECGIDRRRISIGGISAGGCIAAVTAAMARDRGGPALTFQLLQVPVTDLTFSSETARRFAKGYLVSRADFEVGYSAYVPDPVQRTHRYVSPLLADDVTGLPPAMVLTAEYDLLRDEGESYAARLRHSGVPAEIVRARRHVHPSVHSTMPSALRYQSLAAAALARAHRVRTAD